MTAEYSITLSFTDLADLYGELAPFLSPEGMFIPIATPRPVGTRLDFDLVAEAEGARIAGSGEVAWIVGRVGSHPAGMAVRFEELDNGSAEILAVAVERRRASGEEPFDIYRGEGPEEEARTAVPHAVEEELAAAWAGAETVPAADLDLARGRIASLEAQLDETRRESEEPSEELDEARRRIADLEGELERTRREADGARTELEAARAEVVELETRLEAARSAAEEPKSELQTARRRLDEADRELAKNRDRAEKAAAELAEATRRMQELEVDAGKAGQLEAARLASEDRVGTLEGELQAARAEVEETRREAQERTERLETELGEARQSLEQAASLRDELEEARGLEAARASLERELDSEREGVTRMQLLVERVRGEHSTLQEELVAAQAALARSQQEKESLRSALEEARVIEVGRGDLGDEGSEDPFAEVYESSQPEPSSDRRWGIGRVLLAALVGLVAGAAAAVLALNLLG